MQNVKLLFDFLLVILMVFETWVIVFLAMTISFKVGSSLKVLTVVLTSSHRPVVRDFKSGWSSSWLFDNQLAH